MLCKLPPGHFSQLDSLQLQTSFQFCMDIPEIWLCWNLHLDISMKCGFSGILNFFPLLTHLIIVLKLPCASWNASFCWTVPELWPFKFESCRGEIRGHFILQGYRYRRTSSLNENEIIHVTSSSVLEFKTPNFTFVIRLFWHRIRDEGEARRVEPFQKAPAICSDFSQDNANYQC